MVKGGDTFYLGLEVIDKMLTRGKLSRGYFGVSKGFL